MPHAGIGATHVNALLSSMNVPTVRESTLKAREREIGPAIENVAQQSCTLGIEEEKQKWESSEDHTEPVAIGASYDMGWQKRGKGHNSLAGTENNPCCLYCNFKDVYLGNLISCRFFFYAQFAIEYL